MNYYKAESNPEHGDDPFEKSEAYYRAQKRVKRVLGFYWHLASYVIVNLFLIGFFSIKHGDFWNFGTFSTAFFWGIGLAFHFLGVFGSFGFYGKEWKSRKIRAYMNKERSVNLRGSETYDPNLEAELFQIATKKVERLKGFYTHFSVYIVVNLVIVVSNINDLEPGESYFQWHNFFTLGFWGIGVLAHAASIFVPRFVFGSNWETRKMQEFLDRETEKQRWE